MSSRSYICLPCRWSRRARAAYWQNTDMRCPTCHGSLWELDWRWRIPRKGNDKGWKELENKIARDATIVLPWRQRTGAAKLANLETRIAQVERQRESDRKVDRLKKLRKERAETIKRYGSTP